MISGRAYKIFFGEIRRHLSEIVPLFQPPHSTSQDDVLRAAGAFHTIKGGAGFFGLDEIAAAAGRLEALLNAPEFDFSTHRGEIDLLIVALQESATSLPPPGE